MFSFIHAADLHLDSPMHGLERYEGAPVDRARSTTRDAFQNLVDLAIREKVAFVLIAGDVFDGDWKDYSTGLWLNSQLRRLTENRIRVALIRGNHDAQSQITKFIRYPADVVELDSRKPQTIEWADLGVAIHGQSYAKRDVRDDISAKYPAPVSGCFNIGLLHTCAEGREGHEDYAPCRVSNLVLHGYDYWALGHIHLREILNEHPHVVFSGNIQGRHIREDGPRGCALVAVENGQVISLDWHELDVMRWHTLVLSAHDLYSEESVQDAVVLAAREKIESAPDRLWAFRVRFIGRSPAHSLLNRDSEGFTSRLRDRFNTEFADEAWLEKVRIRTQPVVTREAPAEQDLAVAEILTYLQAIKDDPDETAKLADLFEPLRRKLPSEFRESSDSLPWEVAAIGNVLSEVEEMLLTSMAED